MERYYFVAAAALVFAGIVTMARSSAGPGAVYLALGVTFFALGESERRKG